MRAETVNDENGPEEFSGLCLITLDELRIIRRIWVNDKHEFEDSLPRIYKEVFGKEFDDPEWIAASSFEKEEWDILKGVVRDLYPDEELAFEMAYSLIDIENQSNSLGKRKGVNDALEACIRKNYYQNEEDATQFYLNQIYRKKEMGGKYNPKVLDDSYDQIEDEDEDEDE